MGFGIYERAWGKSTITWYRNSIGNELNMLNFDMTKPPGRTYRYYTEEPHFRFGHGLNPLTTFELTNLTIRCSEGYEEEEEEEEGDGSDGSSTNRPIEETRTDPSDYSSSTKPPQRHSDRRLIVLSVTVTNTGPRNGDDIVMAYFVPLDVPDDEPASNLLEQLFEFERISLRSGESTNLFFAVRADRTFRLADRHG